MKCINCNNEFFENPYCESCFDELEDGLSININERLSVEQRLDDILKEINSLLTEVRDIEYLSIFNNFELDKEFLTKLKWRLTYIKDI